MECIVSPKEADYEFCKNINSYTFNEQVADEFFPIRAISYADCDSIVTSGGLINDEYAKKICKQFYILYELLLSTKPPKPANLDKNDCGFLNYWLNEKLRNNNINKPYCVNKFYDILKAKVISSNDSIILKDKIYDIDNKELENMKILLNLHKNYENIYKIRTDPTENYKGLCLQIYKECVKDYESAIINCPNKNTKFCKALDEYRTMYKKLYSLTDKTDKCKANELLKLPEYDEVLKKAQKKNTLTITISFSLIGLVIISIYLRKFTPVGSWLSDIMKKKEIKNTINRETHGLLKGDENNNINISSGPYNVRYHS